MVDLLPVTLPVPAAAARTSIRGEVTEMEVRTREAQEGGVLSSPPSHPILGFVEGRGRGRWLGKTLHGAPGNQSSAPVSGYRFHSTSFQCYWSVVSAFTMTLI